MPPRPEAEKNSAVAIIFRENTFGGRLDAATQIKDAILDSKLETIAFIDKRAISAGALISLSCEKIVMVPGASIGASTVVDQSGAKQSEKYQSYMRGEMRSTAEKNGRRTDIAEGMVDERVVIPGLVDSTRLVTLTTDEAIKYGIADTVLSSVNQILNAYGMDDADVVTLESNWAEDLVRFINNPIISSLLIMVGLVGLFTEIKTPGWGVAGTVALIALGLFFGTNYILQLASIIEILLFIAGVILLILEIFVIPGFGIAGVLGIILMIAGLFLGLISDFPEVSTNMIQTAIVQLAAAFVMSFIFIYILSKFLPKTQMWDKLILQSNIGSTSGYISSKPDFSHFIGKKGVALTDLRPAGAAIIDDNRIDVVTEGDYISKEAKIIVTRTEGSKVVVQLDKKKKTEKKSKKKK
jgi:membrane-bound serine protease (ClpP class)